MSKPALEYFLTRRRDDPAIELVEITHPSFTKIYRLVRNAAQGITVLLETGEEAVFDYYPISITELGDQADLDSGIRIAFGDLGEVLPKELDAVETAGTMYIKPTVLYRAYRRTDLTSPVIGPLRLEAANFSFAKQGATFEASAPYINQNRTGETYNTTRFPMLRGFLK
jgi:uncharacterized protein DUF1833